VSHVRIGALLLPLLLCVACRTPPTDFPLAPPGHALAPAASGPLAELESAFDARVGDDERSGFRLLGENADALLWRLALIDSATRSLDLQYYLWYDDASGSLLAEAVLRAADRGVRVRVLVDDLLSSGEEDVVSAAANAHPNVELRLFNPWQTRSGGPLARGVEFLAQMDRLNSRMHNKLTVADNRVAICGGRNLGDHYFGLGHDYNFHDLDVLAVGPAARKLSEAFDVYWNAAPVAVAGSLAEGSSEQLERLREENRESLRESHELSRLPRGRQDWSEQLRALPAQLHAGSARPVYDAPGSNTIAGGSSRDGILQAIDGAREEILVENAYWIPNESSIAYLYELEERGVRVRFLTNSLASHDVPAVNSGYKKWRRRVLEAGVELYELRHDAAVKALQDTAPVQSEFLGLHAKTFVVDRKVAYVGSHNFDPRSHVINTELGLLVESPGLAHALAQRIEADMQSDNSWRVELDENGNVFWQAGDVRLERQPARNGWQRFQDAIFGILPIEDQL
jgi:putative cardiolipin synthase